MTQLTTEDQSALAALDAAVRVADAKFGDHKDADQSIRLRTLWTHTHSVVDDLEALGPVADTATGMAAVLRTRTRLYEAISATHAAIQRTT